MVISSDFELLMFTTCYRLNVIYTVMNNSLSSTYWLRIFYYLKFQMVFLSDPCHQWIIYQINWQIMRRQELQNYVHLRMAAYLACILTIWVLIIYYDLSFMYEEQTLFAFDC